MGIQNFNAIFNNIDTACKGFITTEQLHAYYDDMAYDNITYDQVKASVLHVCGYQAGGRISRESFLAVLEEISRRQSVEQQAYWDFQAFDYGGSNRISLLDTLLLFREFHGERFSMKTWYDFIESRDEPPGSNVYFDEIRMWLCCYPSGDPASEETIVKEEERLHRQQEQHELNNIDDLKKMMSNTETLDDYRDSVNYNVKRKLNKWKRNGLEAMLNDDGLEADETMEERHPKDHVTRNDLIEAMEVKYEMLRDKLLYEMASLSSAIDGDQPEIFQQLCSQERQLRREGHLEEQINTLPGSKVTLSATLTGLMGEVRMENDKQKMKMNEMRTNLKGQGISDQEIDVAIQTEYQKVIQGDTTCGATLINLQKRYKEEKDAVFTWLRSTAGLSSSSITMEYNRLSRQHLLLGEEGKFVGASIAVGLAERPQQYKTNSATDWDRSRAERLAQLRLSAKKGHKQLRTGRDLMDLDQAVSSGAIGIQREIITEIVKKHSYEREALIYMLQGRDSAVYKANAKRLNVEQRAKRLKTLRNQHKSWQDNKNSDVAVLEKILQEAVGLCYESRLEQMRLENYKLSEGEVNECILGDLEQQQEVEVEMRLTDIRGKAESSEALVLILAKENKARVLEHFDNVAFVILGKVEVREDDKDYLSALEKKYNAIREKIFNMALRDQHGSEWKRLADDKKKEALKQKRKEEKRLRGEGMFDEMESLIGPKSKTLPSLRKMVGEDKPEFEVRFARQKTTGKIQDEVPAEHVIHTNHLADLIPRYDGEEEAMLSWLHADETSKIPKKIQRLRILRLKLEEFLVKMENKFEVAALFLGLFERIEASLHGRHVSDNERQKHLATKRVQIRQQRLLHQEPYKKYRETSGKPNAGDMGGWQVAYLSEVMLRHSEEREQLLQFLQDEGLEDLTEAASQISDEDKKSRLAELHSKRRKLNLENSDDKEEYICVLEEAVAIRAVCKKSEMEQLSRKQVSMEEVTVSLLTELQEEQDRELATLLGMIGRLEEADLKKKHESEETQRKQGSFGNVFVVLTQSEGKAHETELVKALEAKYNQLQECVLLECLVQRSGRTNWEKMSEREKQQKQITLRQEVNSYRATGNTVGMWEALGNITSRETILALMGMMRNEFAVAISNLEDPDVDQVIEKSYEEEKCNPLIDIWQRFEDEKSSLLQALKGTLEEYMEEKNQELHLVRLHREYLLGCRDNNFSFAAILVGLSERQSPNGKPRLTGDKGRYDRLAEMQMEALSSGQKRSPEQKDEIIKSTVKVSQMDNVMQMLERKHRDEHSFFHRLLIENANRELLEEVIVLSQQQRKERLSQLLVKREATPLDQQKEHWYLFLEAVVVKRELCRERLTGDQKEEVNDDIINQALFSDLLSQQNRESEQLFQQMADMTWEELNTLQSDVIQSRRVNAAENVAVVVFSPESTDGSSDTELLEALDGKFDALRDKLLAEALIKQLGEADWKLMSEKERQKKLMELKLKERQLRRDGKFDELARILGDAFEDQELLKKLMGESKEEQERKMRERLEKRRQRKAQGLSDEECDRLEQQDIEKEEVEERKRRRNILGDLQHAYEHEKDELLRRLREGEDKFSKERERQLQLMRLKRDERRARQEDKFDSAALVIGMAKERDDKMKEDMEEERKRQMRLARERLEAARRRKAAGQTQDDDKEPEINIETEDKIVLREAVTMAVDKRHQKERQLLIQVLDESSNSSLKEKIRNMSEEQRKDKLAELQELRKLWRDGDVKDQEEQLEIFREAACIEMESLIEKMRSEGHDLSEDDVKVHILSNLQQQQDSESRLLLADIQNKDPKTLQQIVQVQRMLQEEGWNDNVAFVLLGKSQREVENETEADEDPDKQLVDALEQKYDALREKLLEAALIKGMGEDEWNRLSDKEKQKKLIELKLKERKLREDGNLTEANQLYGDLTENNEILESLLVEDERDEEQKMKDMLERKEELRKEREDQGLSTDDDTLNQIVQEEEEEKTKQRRRNVLENLQTMFDDEKDALMRSLQNQNDRIAQERERQLAVAKLRRDKNRMKQEEKLDSVALIFSMAHEAEEKQKQNIEAERQRMRALAKERLEARKRKKLDKKDKENLEERLKADDEAAGIQELTQDAKDQNVIAGLTKRADGSATQGAILDFMDKRQSEERDLLMELFTLAKSDTTACKQASTMSPEDLKMDLSKLEQERSKWREKSQTVALGFDETIVNKAVWDKYYKQVAESRREQTRILTQAMVQRLELEERNLRTNRPDMTEASIREELSVSLLADLQEKQATESKAIQSLIQKQDSDGLQRLKRVQRTSRREGWYDSLTATLFQMSGADGDKAALATFDKMKAEMEQELEKEKEAFIENAKKKGSDIDIDAALKELERQQRAKRKAMNESFNQQQKSLLERIAARKLQAMNKEGEEIAAAQLILLSQDQQKAEAERIKSAKGKQSNLLQERLEARRLERKRKAEEAKEAERPPSTPSSTTSSRPATVDSKVMPPPFRMTREKTVVDVNVTDEEKNAVVSKLVREQTSLHKKITDTQKQQEEMLQRRLEHRKGKRQEEAQQLFEIGERNKSTYQKSKEDEKTRQMELLKQRVQARRERSRSPNPIAESPIGGIDAPKHHADIILDLFKNTSASKDKSKKLK
ncbi:trichohyalin-like [Ylistrum balloti]|uniref:trichohyalin-like n=1 Tax=Ylistrum balloti TaxID=509963 RepID=UPI0029059826|nr:trichohyalin-like [Ylistrum balloti]